MVAQSLVRSRWPSKGPAPPASRAGRDGTYRPHVTWSAGGRQTSVEPQQPSPALAEDRTGLLDQAVEFGGTLAARSVIRPGGLQEPGRGAREHGAPLTWGGDRDQYLGVRES